MMFSLLLLVSEMGILAAQLSSTPLTVSKDLTSLQNVTETLCATKCNNVSCSLHSRNLVEIPACIPHSVESLNLDFNNLAVIWDQNISNFSQLRNLSVAHNKIREVIWKSNVLPQLKVLDLSYNELTAAPKCLMLEKVEWLSLEGNPLSHIGPFTFTSFPNLAFLNLSSTLIGSNSSGDIDESTFALNKSLTQKDSLKSLKVLDLSNTYLTRVAEAWSIDLPNLEKLYLRNMIVMYSLEDELIQWFPQLEVLDFSGSQELTEVKREIFGNASKLKYLSFQDCNLTSFPPWNLSSSDITVNLRGNPLTCSCELNWMFSDPTRLSLLRPHETICNSLHGDDPAMSLLDLHEMCLKRSPKQDQNFSTPAVTNLNSVTEQQSFTSTAQNIGKQPHVAEAFTVFKSTAADTTTMAPKQQTSSSGQEVVTFSVTVNEVTEGNELSVNSLVATMETSLYTTEPTLVTSVGLTSPAGTTKTSAGQAMTEDSLNEEGGTTPQGYTENDNKERQPDRSTTPSTISACKYDGCRHLQVPCAELQLLRVCSCPGLSGDDVIPDPPYLKNTSQMTDTSVQIHWCSPNSVVENYQLQYKPVGGQMKTINNVHVTMRQYTLYDLTPFTTYKVCVVAFNRRGQSDTENMESGTPCTEFHTKPSYIMIIALVGGLCGLF